MAAQITRKLTKINDPAHGWLSVSIKDLTLLGITGLISNYSYMNSKRVYLEEDSDAGIYLDAAEAAGWKVTVKSTFTERTHVRSLGSYNSWFVYPPIAVGSRIFVPADKTCMDITGEDNKRWFNGGMYAIPKSNPFTRIAGLDDGCAK